MAERNSYTNFFDALMSGDSMTARRYCLDQLTALELDPLAFVEAAADAGYDAIGFHLESLPFDHAASYDLRADVQLRRVFVRRLQDTGLYVHVIEPFLITPDIDFAAHLRNLDLAVEIGARVCGTLAFDPDEPRRADRLADLAAAAGERGLALSIEPYLESSWKTYSEALAAADGVGAHAGVTLDALHVIRGGENWDAVQKTGADRIKAIQLCDGPLARPENWPLSAVTERTVPGEGEFDLRALIPMLPSDIPIGIEVPSLNLARIMPAAERVQFLLERTRRLFDADAAPR